MDISNVFASGLLFIMGFALIVLIQDVLLHKDKLQPIEYAEDGSIIGYKWLEPRWLGGYKSPIQGDRWESKSGKHWLISSRMPTMYNNLGIYAFRSLYSSHLHDFEKRGRVLVKVKLSGIVVEHTEGFRAQEAEILQVIQ